MISTTRRTVVLCLVAGLCLFSVVFGVNIFHGLTTHTAKVHADTPLTPVGKWHLQVAFPDGHQEPSDIQFVPDGGNAANIYNGQVVNYTPFPGTGFWSLSGYNQFQYQFDEQLFANGVQIATIHVQQHASFAADGNSFNAWGQGIVLSMNGNVLAIDQTTTYGVRS